MMKLLPNTVKYAAKCLSLSSMLIVGACSDSSDDDPQPAQPQGETILIKTMSYNIYSGQKAYKGQKGVEAIADVIKEADVDVAGIQEFETNSSKVEYKDMIEVMKERSGMPYAYLIKTWNPNNGDYGNLILSRYPISEEFGVMLPRENQESDKYPRGMACATIEKEGQRFHFAVTHLSLMETNRILQCESIISSLEDISDPIILAGDFNALADSSPMNVLYSRFKIATHNGNYGLTTGTPIPDKAIDFLLYTPGSTLTPVDYHVYYDAYYQSDHFPVVCTFSLTKK